MRVLLADAALSLEAADVSREAGLLTNDATTVALMRRHGLADLASNDDDFAAVAAVTSDGRASAVRPTCGTRPPRRQLNSRTASVLNGP